MRKLQFLLISFLALFLVTGVAMADFSNPRPIYNGAADTTLNTLQGVFTGIGSTIDVKADQLDYAIFTNQSTGANSTYVASLSWNAVGFPFEFGIYEYGNTSNMLAVFEDTGAVADPGDYTTINFNKIGNTISTQFTDASANTTIQLDSTSDWMNSFGFYFAWDNVIYYSEDSLNGNTPASLVYEGKGDNVNIAGQTGNDADHYYVAMEGYGGNLDFNDIVVQMESIQPVPEPATMLLFGTGLIGLAGLGRKKFSKKS